jgi:hypothetical protein
MTPESAADHLLDELHKIGDGRSFDPSQAEVMLAAHKEFSRRVREEAACASCKTIVKCEESIGSKVNLLTDGILVLDDKFFFDVTIQALYDKPWVLEFNVRDKAGCIKSKATKAQILRCSKWRTLVVRIPTTFSRSREAVTAVLTSVLETGDRWIEEYFKYQLRKQRDDVLERLYLEIRTSFQAELADAIFLYYINPRIGGKIVLGDDATNSAVTIFKKSGHYEHKTAIEMAMRLHASAFSFEETIAKHLQPNRKVVEVNTGSIPSASKVGFEQHLLYRQGLLTLHFLLSHGDVWLEAGYPMSLRNSIEDRLRAITPRLFQIVKEWEPNKRPHVNLKSLDLKLEPKGLTGTLGIIHEYIFAKDND